MVGGVEGGERGVEAGGGGREGGGVLMLEATDEVDLGEGLGDASRVSAVGEIGGGVRGARDERGPEGAADFALAEAGQVDVGFHRAVLEFGEEVRFVDVVLVTGADEDGEIVMAVEQWRVGEDVRYSFLNCSRWRGNRIRTPYWLLGFVQSQDECCEDNKGEDRDE